MEQCKYHDRPDCNTPNDQPDCHKSCKYFEGLVDLNDPAIILLIEQAKAVSEAQENGTLFISGSSSKKFKVPSL